LPGPAPSSANRGLVALTLGEIIRKGRAGRWTLKELAARVLKEDGKPISVAYLNDIERARRNPSSDHLLQQFAAALDLPVEFLYFYARRLPPDLYDDKLYGDLGELSKSHIDNVVAAFDAFREMLLKGG
jgi:transcriptional regulator with XRE-family HTH domain